MGISPLFPSARPHGEDLLSTYSKSKSPVHCPRETGRGYLKESLHWIPANRRLSAERTSKQWVVSGY